MLLIALLWLSWICIDNFSLLALLDLSAFQVNSLINLIFFDQTIFFNIHSTELYSFIYMVFSYFIYLFLKWNIYLPSIYVTSIFPDQYPWLRWNKEPYLFSSFFLLLLFIYYIIKGFITTKTLY